MITISYKLAQQGTSHASICGQYDRAWDSHGGRYARRARRSDGTATSVRCYRQSLSSSPSSSGGTRAPALSKSHRVDAGGPSVLPPVPSWNATRPYWSRRPATLNADGREQGLRERLRRLGPSPVALQLA